jgi:hypothetical protein
MLGAFVLCLNSARLYGQASITGTVKDITGAGVQRTYAKLTSETSPEGVFAAQTDSSGVYRFPELPADLYTLKLEAVGFQSPTVKSISISNKESKTIRPRELTVGGGCALNGSDVVPDYFRLVGPELKSGALSGTVREEFGPLVGKSPPLARAEVSQSCGVAVCPKMLTDANGEFVFRGLEPGKYAVRMVRPGHYRFDMSGYRVKAGFETDWSFYLERCVDGVCDVKKRPQKPLAVCE